VFASLACPYFPLAHAVAARPAERAEPFELVYGAVALAEALVRLERHDARAAEVTRLRLVAGLSVEETAQTLGLTVRTVHREWTYARARLFEWLGENELAEEP
jgi:DNA-directed RNA polymerase specialized sigma24 family protein